MDRDDLTIEQLRAMTPAEKFRRMAELFAAGDHAPRTPAEEEDIERVRALWMRLYSKYPVK